MSSQHKGGFEFVSVRTVFQGLTYDLHIVHMCTFKDMSSIKIVSRWEKNVLLDAKALATR